MHIAFYAPMKPPTHPVPSGDRRVARALIAALKAAGHNVALASRLRSWDGAGDERHQRRIAGAGARTAEHLIARYSGVPVNVGGSSRGSPRRPDLWFTYHVYHKAPDWLGPPVSRALGIPYVIAEASIAAKRADGPWRFGYRAALDAIVLADAIVALNPRDIPSLTETRLSAARITLLRPFLRTIADTHEFGESGESSESAGTGQNPDVPGLAITEKAGVLDPLDRSKLRERGRRRVAVGERYGLPPDSVWLVAVAMMRADAKLLSYRRLCDALALVDDGAAPWHLAVVGDGAARNEIEKVLASKLPGQYSVLGRLAQAEVTALLPACDLFVWPAVNEAFGMAMLEAQAAGLPVVAGHSDGVAAIVRDGRTGLLVEPDSPQAMAQAVTRLLRDVELRRRMGHEAWRVTRAEHGLEAAAAQLDEVLTAAQRHRSSQNSTAHGQSLAGVPR